MIEDPNFDHEFLYDEFRLWFKRQKVYQARILLGENCFYLNDLCVFTGLDRTISNEGKAILLIWEKAGYIAELADYSNILYYEFVR